MNFVFYKASLCKRVDFSHWYPHYKPVERAETPKTTLSAVLLALSGATDCK